MIEALGGWLRQVVAAVLLAALIDLLLPNRTMQRYVRLVAGLFILLALASPLLHWIKGDMDAKLAAGIHWAESEPFGSRGEDEGELDAILAEARRISEGRTEQAAQLASVSLETQIKAAVEQEEGAAVDGVEVKASLLQDGTLDVAAVTVRLKAVQAAETEPDVGGRPIAEVNPVAPVTVDIDVGSAGPAGEDSAPAAAEPQAETGTPQDGQAARIAALVAGRFGIGTAKVAVVGPGGEGG